MSGSVGDSGFGLVLTDYGLGLVHSNSPRLRGRIEQSDCVTPSRGATLLTQ